MINRILGFLTVVMVLFSSCKKETRDLQELQDDLIEEYLQRNNLRSRFQKDSSGVYYEVLTVGKDSIKNSDEIFYLQEIKALDGDRIPAFSGLITFSDTYSYNTSHFGHVKLSGFKVAIGKAKLGGKVRAIIPSYLAFGKGGVGTQIQGNQILDIVFDVVNATNKTAAEDSLITRYLQTLPETYIRDESGIYYYVETEGDGVDITPISTINTIYAGKFLSGVVFDSNTSANPLSATLSSNVIPGWGIILPKIKTGGKMKVAIPSYHAYSTTGYGSIPPNTPLFFEIEVLK